MKIANIFVMVIIASNIIPTLAQDFLAGSSTDHSETTSRRDADLIIGFSVLVLSITIAIISICSTILLYEMGWV